MVPALKNPRSAVAWLAVGMLTGGSVHAESNPYYFGGSLGASHVSNIYRQANTGNDDNVTTTSVLGGLDQTIGRQRIYADGSLQDNRYGSNTTLNNRSYSLKGGLDWTTAGKISGTLSGNTNSSLANYNIGGGIDPIFKKITQKNNQFQSLVRVGLVTRYSVEASVTHSDLSYSEPEYQILDYRQDAGSLGLFYRPNENLRVGLSSRHTVGVYPRYRTLYTPFPAAHPVIITVEDDFRRDDIDLTTNWTFSGASRIDARLSRSKLRRDVATAQDFYGTTGFIAWAWQPRVRLSFYTQLVRDNGQDGGSVGNYLNRIATTLQTTVNYDLTGKVALSAGASARRSDSNSDTALYKAYDNDRSYNVGVRWNYSRSLSVSCQGSRSGRSSSTPQYVYNASSYGCTAQAIVY